MCGLGPVGDIEAFAPAREVMLKQRTAAANDGYSPQRSAPSCERVWSARQFLRRDRSHISNNIITIRDLQPIETFAAQHNAGKATDRLLSFRSKGDFSYESGFI